MKSTARSSRSSKTAATSRLSPPVEYRIDDLARTAGTTVRNVRAYQDRGLLPPPERRGRVAVYTETHLARLRVIGALLDRGYTISNISELLESWQSGRELGHLLGLEEAITSPWSDEVPEYMSMARLLADFGPAFSPSALAQARALGIIEIEGLRVRVPSKRMLFAAKELVAAGIPLEEMLDIVRMLRGNVERVANEMVMLIVKHVFDPLGKDLPPPKEVPRLVELVWRLRPLVNMAVNAEVARAMGKAAQLNLGNRLEYILEHLHDLSSASEAGIPATPSRPTTKR
jgi:DNA-binding transcriptional MerR regulator